LQRTIRIRISIIVVLYEKLIQKKMKVFPVINEQIFLKRGSIVPFIIVFSLPVLLYLHTLRFGLADYDDNAIITNNIDFLSNIKNVPGAFLNDAFLLKTNPPQTKTYVADIFYRPVQTVSFMADIKLSGGNNIWMYHLTNILLLGLIACLLFLVLRKFLMPVKFAILSTLIYCAHPLFISSVAWIPARGDLLLLFFSLISFLFFIEQVKTKKVVYSFLNGITFFIALLCKESAAILPVLFILYYFAYSSDKISIFHREQKFYIPNILLYIAAGACWYWLRSMAIGDLSNRNDVGLIPFISNLRTIPESLAMFVLPVKIAPIPGYSFLNTSIGILVIAGIIALFIRNKEKTFKEKIFWLAWFLLLLLPTMIYKNEYVDYLNHRFFLPLTGILIFVLISFPEKWFEKNNIYISWILVSVFLFLSLLTFFKSNTYSQPMVFYNSVISQNPANALMYNNRGYEKMNSGDVQDAINDYSKAIELNPHFELAYYNRGNAYGSKGDLEKAIKDYDKTIDLNPDGIFAFNNRGNAYFNKGEFELAIKDYDKVVELDPNYVYAYYNRANAYYNKGNLDLAKTNYNRAIELNPEYVDAYYNRGIVYYMKGDTENAIKDIEKAGELNPNDPEFVKIREMLMKLKSSLNQQKK
jgi:tetratricopeptide (TPR) repeat protein